MKEETFEFELTEDHANDVFQMVLDKDVRDYKDAVEVFQMPFGQPHVFVDDMLKDGLLILDTVVDLILLRDIEITVFDGMLQDVLFRLMKSEGLSPDEDRSCPSLLSLSFL
jgi:hypothetical protein